MSYNLTPNHKVRTGGSVQTLVEINPDVPLDMRSLALHVLAGDKAAACALSDLTSENWTKGERLTLAYVNRIEEALIEARRYLSGHGSHPEIVLGMIWRCEVEGKAIGRHF